MIKIGREIIKEKGLPKGYVITDSNIIEYYKDLMGEKGFVIKAGEESKSLEVYSEIVNELKNEDTIISFGGGVVGDLAGFVASTYKRGIKLIHVPTSLLAMVDGSIGGKNGINLGKRKNYLGTIYQADEILIDLSFLETLPEKRFEEGVAEIIKYGFLFGNPSLERLRKGINPHDSDLQEIISECAKTKMEVIERDKNESGYRDVLNFGHTIGHSIELIYNLSHGEAISIGMVKELELVGKMEEAENLKAILENNRLPIEFPDNFNSEEVLELMKSDKKGTFVFSFGKENYNIKLNEGDVRNFLK